jgi:hypothetical protein
MGAFISTTWVKAAKGTWLPVRKTPVDEIDFPPKASLEEIVPKLLSEEVVVDRLELATLPELDGP